MKLLILSAAALLIPAAALIAALRVAARRDMPLSKPMMMPVGFREKMAHAIYLAEGGDKTRFPYGVTTRGKLTPSEAREICLKAIDRHWGLWSDDGQPGGFHRGFVHEMANHWAPIGADNDPDNLNKNWERNVCWFLEHDK